MVNHLQQKCEQIVGVKIKLLEKFEKYVAQKSVFFAKKSLLTLSIHFNLLK